MKYTRSKLHESSPRTAKTASGGVFGLHANNDVSTYNGTALVQIVLHLATTTTKTRSDHLFSGSSSMVTV
jgi:hypothetical protein